MPHPSATRFLVLHALRLKGFAEASVIAGVTGMAEGTVEDELAELSDTGLVQHREGRVSGWSLTASGRAEHADLVGRELEDADGGPIVDEAYGRFLALNADMLAVCTAWQLRDVDGASVPNDHDDAGYDAGVVDRLRAIHEQVAPVTVDLGRVLDRFRGYQGRLDAAIAQVQAGQRDWFTKPVIDSYHTVWFELHEDLLATLGRERSREASRTS